MVRNIVILGGNSHKHLVENVCNHLGIPPGKITLSKFSVGETRVEIEESVRGKDVFVIQSGGGKVNDHFMELLITISACKTASATRVTAVLPLFPYSRQPDIPYNKLGAPLSKGVVHRQRNGAYTFDSRPQSPNPNSAGPTEPQNLQKQLGRLQMTNGDHTKADEKRNGSDHTSTPTEPSKAPYHSTAAEITQPPKFVPQRGYRQWVAQAGTLVANLLTCAGADHVITMDLHDPQYQGFFDIPVDNLYGRHLLKKHIQFQIPAYKNAVIVSPDAGGAKRATAIADALGVDFALIHKERRPTQITDRQNATMMLVGDVADKTAILVDDLADTSNTITRAAKLLKKEGATMVYALVTHGVLSGDAIDRINASHLDRVVVTNSVDQSEHARQCPKLEVLDVSSMFAEAIRRVHHGESISVLFHHN
ncbi:ribose-phosphate pyrophosphokinase II [Eremomyces bilateralis CBS 781.70]|uniref:Ribose-phosphate pyrophosphokinase II n=1 Tax=Eremomyces bilateralis CBS 781.70 TaxID=1392243 RepID=A0A6G1FVJ4_9PEZI|nr:ribose-phosphate pyrophosphokinase II [Eremomyces bilateralis CBS 781.70]KAF1809793.1 ribose-phosphate pyrophosphokinase II [Eremomyces bilateralis CBS 781.70]